MALLVFLGIQGRTSLASLDSARQPSAPTYCWRKGSAIYRDRNHDGRIDWEVSGESWRHDGLRLTGPFTGEQCTWQPWTTVINQGDDSELILPNDLCATSQFYCAQQAPP